MTTLATTRLKTLEGEIECAFQRMREAWREIGANLAIINAERLYPTDTFEEYVQMRWGLRRATAYEWMSASGVVANLANVSSNGHAVIEPPQRVAHAVILARLPAERQAEALQAARELAAERGRAEPTIYEVKRVVFATLSIQSPQSPEMAAHERQQRATCEHIRRMWERLDAEHRKQLLRELERNV